MVGTIFLGTGQPLEGNATGFHLIGNGFTLVLIQGVVFAFASVNWSVRRWGVQDTDDGAKTINSVIWRIGLM